MVVGELSQSLVKELLEPIGDEDEQARHQPASSFFDLVDLRPVSVTLPCSSKTGRLVSRSVMTRCRRGLLLCMSVARFILIAIIEPTGSRNAAEFGVGLKRGFRHWLEQAHSE